MCGVCQNLVMYLQHSSGALFVFVSGSLLAAVHLYTVRIFPIALLYAAKSAESSGCPTISLK